MKDFDVLIESPGRINLIGEHIDYNGGLVLPAAIDLTIKLYFKENGSNTCHIYSKNYDARFDIDLDKVAVSKEEWHNYFLGVIHFIQKKHPKSIKGFDCVLDSNLPIGSGVSSSAALECGVAKGLDALFNIGLSDLEIITISRDAEHHFVGTKCGIMDQFAVVKGKKEKFILLNSETLAYEYASVDLEYYDIVLLNTNVSHNLATSEYNTRRHECEEGFKKIQQKYPQFNYLAEVPFSAIEELKSELSAKTYDRLYYVVQENLRTMEAAKALADKDFDKLGFLLYASHQGLSELYEVSCPELDYLVAFSKDWDSVLGARMMGGGFGGCTINLVKKDGTLTFIDAAVLAYQNKFGIKLSPFRVGLGDGVRRI